MRVYVRPIIGSSFELDVDEDDTISNIKQRLLDRFLHPPEQWRSQMELVLVYEAAIVEDDVTVRSLGASDGAVFHLTVRFSRLLSPLHTSAPSVKSVEPPWAFSEGGKQISFQGSNFRRGWTIKCMFGSTVVPGIFKSETEVVCICPPHPPGLVTVEVSNNGSSFSKDRKLFAYVDREACESLVLVPSSCSSYHGVLATESSSSWVRRGRGDDD
eukprot:GILJ01007701.1.p1 GENE.GILJ01007701.1~~GILJ01007701.1.p1  ORF type:complete len:214 (+),score=11.26 GILJ01007701.1:215-856(+)